MDTISYLQGINKRFKSGISREHSYRADLENLIRTLVPNVDVTNEPANVTDCGNPDYVISQNGIPIGYIEAKDIGKDLNSKSYKEQFTRYKNALDNLIITDYIWFQFFQNGELVFETKIGQIENHEIAILGNNFVELENRIKDFCQFQGQTIKSSAKLAQMMASKARLFQNILENATLSDEQTQENTSLQEQYRAFQQVLIHDITPKAFADLYAQTLTYGMFAARLHDDTLASFSRQEAAEKIPKSNPFLRKLFQYIAGYDIDPRIITTVENLADVFRSTNVKELLKDFGSSTQQTDPIIHFYETFLAEYDPKLRKARGVWYTPEPVVKFIVRAVDDVLKTEFGLKDGLADTSKVKTKVQVQTHDKRSKTGFTETEKEVHRVQILDPATGTGTFLAEVIKYIYSTKFKAMQGVWSSYVENDLIPRLNGFELLMASYAMAHLQLDLLLSETGYKATKDKRLRVYLTNSLEEYHPDTGTLFANWLSTEANEANHIKRDTPVMCVMGNPPYSGISSNSGKWISDLIEDYKYVDGVHFKERKHWLNDDYVKFIRYGQQFIEKNGSGVLAFINPHGFLDNPTFRGMRWNLLKTYDKIYTIDLHGNSNKKETAPDGSKDVNVFDIQQGVSINIFIKIGKKAKNELGKVFSFDIFGKRKSKYDFLTGGMISNIDWQEIVSNKPNYAFKQINIKDQQEYIKGIKISELFKTWTTGVQTSRDKIALSFNDKEVISKISEFCDSSLPLDEIRAKYFTQTSIKYPPGDTRDWKLNASRLSSKKNELLDNIRNYTFRPFDNRKIIFHDNILSWSRNDVSKHLFEDNLSFITARSNKKGVDHFFISRNPSDVKCGERTTGSIFCPLYIYIKNEGQQNLDQSINRIPNLSVEKINKIAENLTLTFTNEKQTTKDTFAPIDILDYIYAVLHSPTYREKYKEFLKIDFPRVPYPKDQETFWQLVELGKQIREIHLLESEQTENYITSYPEGGDNIITRKMSKNSLGYEATNKTHGKVWINDKQYFDGVPLVAWEFYIGGYQPAQKWLKDRKDRELSFEDILHYQKIIVALTETDRLMKEIDKIEIE